MKFGNRISIASAKAEHYSAFSQLQEACFSDDLLKLDQRTFLSKINEEPNYIFVATYAEKFAGYAIMTDRAWRPWTSGDFLAVSKEFYGRGIAYHLLHKGLMNAKRPFLRIFVRPTNSSAIKLYRRLGFRKFGVRKNNYPDGEDAIIMMALTQHDT